MVDSSPGKPRPPTGPARRGCPMTVGVSSAPVRRNRALVNLSPQSYESPRSYEMDTAAAPGESRRRSGRCRSPGRRPGRNPSEAPVEDAALDAFRRERALDVDET